MTTERGHDPTIKKSPVRAIFFDLGNVLVMYDPQIAARKLMDFLGMTEADVWNAIFLSDLERSYSKGKITSRQFFEGLIKHFPRPLPYETFCDIWNHIFWANEGMERLVQSLSGRYALYLISNTNELHFEFIKKEFSIVKYFNRCFPSHEIGFRKPEPEIFERALSQVKVQAEEAVFIDDVLEFVEAARAIGMGGIHFKSQEGLERDLRDLGVLF